MKSWTWIVVPALLLAGCSKKAQEPPKKTTIHEIMKDEVDNRGDDVWAVGNAHMSEDAGLNGKTMTDADWAKLAAAANSLHQAALDLASLPDPLTVVKPGAKIAFEDTSWGDKATSVQKNVSADPQGLRDLANGLAEHTTEIATAAGKHDAATAGKLLDELDGVCDGCQVKSWYPTQRAPIAKIRKTSGTDPST
jgi:hypothetical protein